MSSFLEDCLRKTGLAVSAEQVRLLNQYYEMLTEKNKVMNLTAITDYREIVVKHFADSLAVIHAVDLQKTVSVIDVGTGAGFPGMVLKIVFPKLKITLLDSLQKRIGFLQETAKNLKLDGLVFLHGRAEDYAHQSAYREQYDLCVSRAVARLSSLSEYCLPFVKPGNYFVAYKAGECAEELAKAGNAIRTLGGGNAVCISYQLPDTDIRRTFVKIRKDAHTDIRFPRKAGTPTKEPLA